MWLRKSTSSQSRMIGPFVSDSDFKTVQTGLTIANTDVKISINGAAGVSKNSGGGTHRNNGDYSLTFDATDTGTVGEFSVTVLVSGALVVKAKWWVLEQAVYDALMAASALGYVTDQPVNATKFGGTTVTGRDLGASVLLSSGTGTGQLSLSSGAVLLQATQTGVTIPTVTNLTNAPGAGDFTATMKTSIGTAVAASAVASVTGNVGGNVTGSVGSVVGAVGSVTGAVGSVTGAVGSVTGNVGGNVVGSVASVTGNVGGNVVGSVASVTGNVGGSVASLTTNNDKTGYALSNTGIDNVLDRTAGVETNFTLRQALRLMLSSAAAKLSGAATTTVTIRDINDTKNRITATVDANGNRSAVTTDVT